MNLPSQTPDSQETGFFRCPVNTDAIIRVGWRKAGVTVQETSIDGFTVLASPRNASKLKNGRQWVLEYDEARTEVHPQWVFNATDGQVQLGLRRLRDLTKPDPIRSSLLSRFGGKRYDDPSYSAAAYGGFVMFLFCLLALPGIGDSLGTSGRIQDAIQWVVQGMNDSITTYL